MFLESTVTGHFVGECPEGRSLCRHGELSQAMRNRGIEVFMGSPSAVEPGMRDTMAADLQALLSVSGLPGNTLPEAMVAAHLACTGDAALHHRYVRLSTRL